MNQPTSSVSVNKVIRFAAMRSYEASNYKIALSLLQKIPFKRREADVHFRIAKLLHLLDREEDAVTYVEKVITKLGPLPQFIHFEDYLRRDISNSADRKKDEPKSTQEPLLDEATQAAPTWRRRDALLDIYLQGIREDAVGGGTLKGLILEEFAMHNYKQVVTLVQSASTSNRLQLLAAEADNPLRTAIALSTYLETGTSELKSALYNQAFQALGITRDFILSTYQKSLESKGYWTESARIFRELALEKHSASQEGGELRAEFLRKSSFRWRKGLALDAAIEDSRQATHLDLSKKSLVVLAGNLELAEDYKLAGEIYEHLYWNHGGTKYFAHRAIFCYTRIDREEAAVDLLSHYLFNNSSLASSLADRADKDISKILQKNQPCDANTLPLETALLYFENGDYNRAFSAAQRALFSSYAYYTNSLELFSAILLREGNVSLALKYFVASTERIRYQLDGNKFKKLSNHAKTLSRYLEMREFLPIQENIFLFESHLANRIDCNPAAICEELLSDSTFDGLVLWAIRDTTEIPESLHQHPRVMFVRRQSFLYWMALSCARRLVNNVTFPLEFIRRSGQSYMNTWHGTPLKTLGRDIGTGTFEHGNSARNFVQATTLLFPNEFTKKVELERYDAKSLIHARCEVTGYPRNDVLVNLDESLAGNTRSKLGIIPEEKILLYAPTWRGGQGTEHFDCEKLVADLSELAKTGYTVVFRGHPHTVKLLEGISLPAVVPPLSIDSYELMACADVLVTDYSSIGIDFLVTGRPVIWYYYDYEEYQSERGLYFTPGEFPGIEAKNIDDLTRTLLSQNFELDDEKLKTIERFTDAEDGKASSRAVDLLLSDPGAVEQNEHQKPTILFRHSFIPNGITTALLGVIHNLDETEWDIVVAFDRQRASQDPRIQAVLDSLPVYVDRIPWTQSKANDTNFLAAKRDLLSTYNVHSEQQLSMLNRGWELEAERIFGPHAFDVVVEYEGYSNNWTGIIANTRASRKRLFYLHNDMVGELARRFPWLEASHTIAVLNHFSIVNLNAPLEKKNIPLLEANASCKIQEKFIQDNVIPTHDLIERATESLPEDFISWRDPKRRLAIIVARVSVEKNQAVAIQALSAVPEEDRPQLAIIGGGPLLEECITNSQQILRQEDIYFSGDISNPLPFYSEADVLLITSLHEGQPMVLHEALALGLDAVVMPIEGCVDFVNRFGGTVIDRDTDALAKQFASIQQKDPSTKRSIEQSVSSYKQTVVDSVMRNFNHMTRPSS